MKQSGQKTGRRNRAAEIELGSSDNPRVFFVHCFASPGWESRGEAADFAEWLKLAQEDHQEFLADDDDEA